jgi:UDP-N-acetylmuramoyl-tripeptide--D-alanyl-D-alanine ligase
MKPLALEEIRRAVLGRWMSRGQEVTVLGVSTDSRGARKGDLFVALKGERFDGHEFLVQAAKAGCVSAMVNRDAAVDPGAADGFVGRLIGVEDTTRALGELAAYYRRLLPTTVLAVTGSNGKTTVKRMIHHVLSKRLTGSCSPKSFNNQIGVPLTLLSAGAGDDYVVCELGSNSPGEIAALGRIVQPDIAVIVSVGATHLEKLGSVDRVAVEKASLLEMLAPDGLAVVWADSEHLDRALRAHDRRLIRFGVSDAAELRLTGYEPVGRAQRFQLNGRWWVDLPLSGRHNSLNALATIAVAQRFGFTQEEASAALADFAGAEMRMQWIEAGEVAVINDAYNANPSSMVAAAEVLTEGPGARKVMIAGDMRELGEQAIEMHVQLGREIASRKVDLLIGVGTLGRYIAKGAAEGGIAAEAFGTVEDACRAVGELLRRGDVVLIKGSRAMAMERLVEPIRGAFGGGARAAPAGGAKGRTP